MQSWTTSYVPISEWVISEGDTKFLNAMKLMPPKDPESIVHLGTLHYSLKVPTLDMNVLALTFGTIH